MLVFVLMMFFEIVFSLRETSDIFMKIQLLNRKCNSCMLHIQIYVHPCTYLCVGCCAGGLVEIRNMLG